MPNAAEYRTMAAEEIALPACAGHPTPAKSTFGERMNYSRRRTTRKRWKASARCSGRRVRTQSGEENRIR
jgi:hypothetical protein